MGESLANNSGGNTGKSLNVTGCFFVHTVSPTPSSPVSKIPIISPG